MPTLLNRSYTLNQKSPYCDKIILKQGNKEAQTLTFALLDGGVAVNLAGCAVVFFATKPSGATLVNSCSVTSEASGKVAYVVTEQTSIEAGALTDCYLQIIKTGQVLNTFDLNVEILKSKNYDTAIETASEFTAFQALSGQIAANTTGMGTLASLLTTAKTSLVAAINELFTGKANNDGWNPVVDTWAYATPSTITVPAGATSKYYKGGRVKFTQSGVVKKGVVLAVANTLLTILVNTDFPLTNVAITDIYYSDQQSPAGYPHWFNVAAPAWNVSSGIDNGSGGQPTTDKHMVKVDGNTLEGFILASGTKASTTWYISFSFPYAITPINSMSIGSSNVYWPDQDRGGMCTYKNGTIYCSWDFSLPIVDNQASMIVSAMFKLIF